MAQQGDNASTSTPPASIYLEESDDESDRELRRSKRRPKRYESDEDFVLESDEEAPCQSTTFLYNELNESRFDVVFLRATLYSRLCGESLLIKGIAVTHPVSMRY